MNNNLDNIAFQIILLAGNGRSSAMEAIQEAKKNNFDVALKKIKESKSELNEAHKFQTELLQKEAQGKNKDINLLLIHAQDHLMTSLLLKDVASEIVELYQNK